MDETPLITTIAAGFTAAWVLGLFTQWLRLSPIVGYLLAGVLIGPSTPGFIGDQELAHQLADIGVILLMFGVGLHFKLNELLAVRSVALPGALVASCTITLVSSGLLWLLGLEGKTALLIGMSMAVTSTVLLVRVLMEADALRSPAGHLAVGWLLVEDVLTIIALVLLPVFGQSAAMGDSSAGWTGPLLEVALALAKLAALIGVFFVAGRRVIPWVLGRVARLRSRELFTLTVLVFSVAIAAGSYALFGASMALGAFLAGMVVGQSPVSHQAAADALPLRDFFAVLFFVSVGMLFDPLILLSHPLLLLVMVGIIVLFKPLLAFALVVVLGQPVATALTVALGLGQIGEFSFILSEVARDKGLMSPEGHSLLVAAAIFAITLNPLCFRSRVKLERWLRTYPAFWAWLNSRAEYRVAEVNATAAELIAGEGSSRSAIVVGYGPVGRTVERLLRDSGLATVVIDMNMDTVLEISREDRIAIFGDAANHHILQMAGVEKATHLVLTLPQTANRSAIVSIARSMNEKLRIFVRAHYLRDQGELEQVGATSVIFEEAEAAVALARLVLMDTGAGAERIDNTVRDIRMRLMLENMTSMRSQRVRDIMVPWPRVRLLSNSYPLERVRRLAGEQHFSRWPVIDGNSGEPIGYLLVKDLVGHDSSQNWTSLLRTMGTIRPDNDIESALLYFQREGATICLVKDGERTVGMITIEDILEQVVGRIEDEYPHGPQLSLCDVTLTDDSILSLESENSGDAIARLAGAIPGGRLPGGVDIAALATARERDSSTDIGLGVAIPHARCPGLDGPLVVFGRSAQGVVFGRGTGEPVRLFFLLVTPVDQAEAQVQLLGQLAQFAGNVAARQELLEAGSAEEIMGIFRRFQPA